MSPKLIDAESDAIMLVVVDNDRDPGVDRDHDRGQGNVVGSAEGVGKDGDITDADVDVEDDGGGGEELVILIHHGFRPRNLSRRSSSDNGDVGL